MVTVWYDWRDEKWHVVRDNGCHMTHDTEHACIDDIITALNMIHADNVVARPVARPVATEGEQDADQG